MPGRLNRALGRAGRIAAERRTAREWDPSPPDFVGVGAQRSGTTWWHRLICDHPAVHSVGKELHFFDEFFRREFSDADVAAYHGLFRRPPGLIAGEWTPRYMHDFWTPPLLRAAAPRARILVLLRDPLRRYESGLSHEIDRFTRSVRARRRRRHAATMSANDALARSLYAPQMRRLFEHFDRGSVLVLQYERCIDDPEAELSRTYRFLGLEDVGHLPAFLRERTGLSHPAVPTKVGATEEASRIIRRDVAELGEIVPELDLELWSSARPAP